MRRIGLKTIALLAAAIGVSGCIVEITFDPIGADASVEGSWTINGAAPTAESCAALGISHVRVRFFDGDRWADHPELVFSCTEGGFDTRPQAVVADGQWTMALVAIDADGDAIAMGPTQTVDTLAGGGHIALTPIDFMASGVTALAGSWTIGGAAPTEASCTALGATEVHVQFLDDAGDPDPTATLKLACADGSFVQEMQAGEYLVRLALVDAASGTLAMVEPQTVTIAEGMTTTLIPVDFAGEPFDPTGTDSVLQATWLIGGSDAPMADQCEAVGGAEADLLFYAESDTAREEAVILALGACENGAFDSGSPALAAGTYIVDARIRDAANFTVSSVELGTLTVEAGVPFVVGPVDFRLEAAQVRIFMQWDEPLSGVPSSCEDASVTSILWRIDYDDGAGGVATVASSEGEAACTPYAESSDATLAAGTYRLYYEGSRTAAPYLKNWEVQAPCEATLDGPGGLAIAYCEATYSTAF